MVPNLLAHGIDLELTCTCSSDGSTAVPITEQIFTQSAAKCVFKLEHYKNRQLLVIVSHFAKILPFLTPSCYHSPQLCHSTSLTRNMAGALEVLGVKVGLVFPLNPNL